MAHTSTPARRSSLVISLDGPVRSRRMVLGAGASLLVGTVLVLVGVWALGAAFYLSFREDVLSSLLARQAALRYAYEDRIAGLRAQMDRVTSRQLVDQDSFEGKMQELASRQAQLETRQAIVNALMAQATTSLGIASGQASASSLSVGNSSLSVGKTASAAPLPPARPAAVMPLPSVTTPPPAGTTAFAPAPEPFGEMPSLRGSGGGAPAASRPSQALLPPESAPLPGPRPAPQRRVEGTQPERTSLFEAPLPARKDPAVAGARLQRISAALEGVDRSQHAALGAVEGAARAQALKLKGVVAEIGLDVSRLKSVPQSARNEGGPFVPVPIDAEDGPFGAAVDRLQKTLLEAERLRSAIRLLPLSKPLAGEPEVTSTFGTRLDPFTRGLAMHTGLDLREDWGTSVRATAPGTVVSAEWTGGYGNLVEIDHGNGLTTRYGHLSAFLVSPGDRIQAGTIVGRVGSTGRSTGPHLHYETRIDGEPVDPMRFLRAARRLAPG